MVNLAKDLEKAPDRNPNGGFRTKESKVIDELWKAFGGFSHPNIQYNLQILYNIYRHHKYL